MRGTAAVVEMLRGQAVDGRATSNTTGNPELRLRGVKGPITKTTAHLGSSVAVAGAFNEKTFFNMRGLVEGTVGM